MLRKFNNFIKKSNENGKTTNFMMKNNNNNENAKKADENKVCLVPCHSRYINGTWRSKEVGLKPVSQCLTVSQ